MFNTATPSSTKALSKLFAAQRPQEHTNLVFLLHARAKHGDTNSHKNKHNRYVDQSQYNLGYNPTSRTSYTMGGVA